MNMPPKAVTVTEELWVHRSDGARVKVDITWLAKYLENNPGLLLSLGFVRKDPRPTNPMPLPVYKPPISAIKPIPAGANVHPSWLTAPTNPNAGKPQAVIAAKLCEFPKLEPRKR